MVYTSGDDGGQKDFGNAIWRMSGRGKAGKEASKGYGLHNTCKYKWIHSGKIIT